MALRHRSGLTIERRREIRADQTGDSRMVAVMRPRAPRTEYLTVVVGEIGKGDPVTPRAVLEAMQDLVAQYGKVI